MTYPLGEKMKSSKSEKSEKSELAQGFEVLSQTVKIFPCARRWDELAATQMDGVRHCDSCNQMVYEIEDVDGLKLAIASKRCVRVSNSSGGYFVGGIAVDYRPTSTTLNWDE